MLTSTAPDTAAYNWFFLPMGILLALGLVFAVFDLRRGPREGRFNSTTRPWVYRIVLGVSGLGVFVFFSLAVFGPLTSFTAENNKLNAQIARQANAQYGTHLSAAEAGDAFSFGSPYKLKDGSILIIETVSTHGKTTTYDIKHYVPASN